MATYKVLQDIEAEDKLLGPLSLRQFIYAIITVGILFLAWQMSKIQIFLALPFMVPAAFFGLLAAPLGVNQSSEIWLLAKIRFFLKPRRRIWDQTGLKELVTITVPKKVERQRTNNLSQTEVKSRLQALANTIDSRGWAIKNVNVNLSAQPGYLQDESSDRLIDVSNMPQEVASYDVTVNDDILDAQNNPTAQHLDQMISASSQAHREELIQQVHQRAAAANTPEAAGTPVPDYWFMNQPASGQSAAPKAPAAANPTAEEQALLENIHEKQSHKTNPYGHMRTLQPVDKQPAGAKSAAPATGTQTPDPGILNLANNDDLDVATIARQAKKTHDQSSEDEVVISLR